MTTFVVATDSVHTSAALCDYLFDRVDEDDTVYAINSLHDEDADAEAIRDGKDALNAVASRLAAATTVETGTGVVDVGIERLPAEPVVGHTGLSLGGR